MTCRNGSFLNVPNAALRLRLYLKRIHADFYFTAKVGCISLRSDEIGVASFLHEFAAKDGPVFDNSWQRCCRENRSSQKVNAAAINAN